MYFRRSSSCVTRILRRMRRVAGRVQLGWVVILGWWISEAQGELFGNQPVGGGCLDTLADTTINKTLTYVACPYVSRANQSSNYCMRSDVVSRVDGTYLTLESDGCPDHPIARSPSTKLSYYPPSQAGSEGVANISDSQSLYIPTFHTYKFMLPLSPKLASSPSSTGGSVVGVAVNGIPLFNNQVCSVSDGSCGEVSSSSIVHKTITLEFDECLGHVDSGGHYHYHLLPICLLSSVGVTVPSDPAFWVTMLSSSNYTQFFPKVSNPSPLIGFALDGFPIYGPYNETGDLMDNSTLDECGGTFGADGGYRYYASPAPPYFVGCFKGIKGSFEIVSSSDTACPYNGVLYDTYTNCFKSKGPFFLFRTDTEGENWEVFFIIAAIGNGLLFLLCLWRTLELLFETLDQRIIHIALLDFVLLTQVLFYAVDPNHTRGIFPDLVSSLLYGAQFWATDGLIALAIIKHVNALLPLRKANERLKNIKNDQEKRTILKRMIKKDKRLRKSLTAVLDFQQHLRMSRGSVVAMTRGSSIQTNIPGNPRIKQKVWFDFKFARSYFAFLIFCIVFQTWSDIMRVSVQENHWWISIWRFLYLGSGYLLAILFVISLFSIYNIAKFLATRSLQKMAAYIFDTVLIVCTCLCMSTIELYLFLNKDIPTSSSVYFGLTAANIGVRLLLYFLTWYRTRIQFARYQNPFASFADSVFSRRSSKVDSGLPNPGRKSSRLSMHEVKRAVLMARHISEDSERSGPEVRLSNLHRSGGKVELREGLFPHEGKRPLAHQIHRRTGGSLMSESGTVQYPAGALQKMETKQDLEKAQLDNDIEMLCMHLRSCTPSQSKSQLFNPLDQTNCMRTGLDMGGSLPTLPHLDDEEKAKQRLRPRKRQASESRLRKANGFGSPSEFLRSNSYQRASSLGYSGVELISRRGTSVGVLSPTRQVRHSKSDVEREVPRYYSPGNSKSDVERETTPERVISSPMRPSVQREPREHRSVRACGIRADSYDFRDDRSEKSLRQSPRDVDSSAKCFTQSPRAVDNPKSLGQSPRGVDSSLQNYHCAQLSMASNQSHVETSCSPQRKAGMSGTSCSEIIPSPGGKPGVHAMETVEEKGPGCLAGQVRTNRRQ